MKLYRSAVNRLFLLAAIFFSSEVLPCAVCVGGFTQDKLDAYFYTGLTLTSLPFVILGLFYLLFRYYKKKNMNNS